MSPAYILFVIRIQDVIWQSRSFRSKSPSLYVRATLGATVQRTQTFKDNLSPAWNATLSLSSPDESANLNIQVKHSSFASDSCIACVDITIADLLERCANGEAQVELHPPSRKGKRVMKRVGILHLRLQRSDEIVNARNELLGAEQAIAQSQYASSSKTGDTTAAIADVGEQLHEGSDLYKALGVLCSKLNMFVDAIDAISKVHPYVNAAWQLTSALYKAVSSQIEADSKIIDLVNAMKEAFDFVGEIGPLRETTRILYRAVIALLRQTVECCIFIQQYTSRTFIGRMLDLGGRMKIDELTQSFATLRGNIDSGTNLSAALISARMSEFVDALFLRDRLDPRQTSAVNRPQCLAGTRTEIRERILDWMFSNSSQNIFWLHGVAGSGKSTVSTTVAEYFSSISRRGAFLCFERGKSEPDAVIRTIAYHLAMFDCSIAKGVIDAIKEDNNLAMTSAANQFEKLLLQPLIAASVAMRGPIIVVLDALDECGTPESRRSLMELIRDEFPKLPKNFRFLVTSRPEQDISNALSSETDSILPVQLEHNSRTSKEDVQSYICFEMSRVIMKVAKVPVPEEWPWDENMKRLGKAAGGLFVWAATAVKLVSLCSDDPFQRLEDLVENSSSLNLQDLYATVLKSGTRWENPSSKARFSQILSLILFSKIPLSIASVDGVLGYTAQRSSAFLLLGLKSVIDFSSDGPIRLFHTSFSDYLLAPERSSDPWFIDVPVQKLYLAARCFEVMKTSLRFNICDLESSHIHNDHIPDLQTRVDTQIRPYLLYACLFWARHLRETHFSPTLMEQLIGFLHQRLLYWLEVLSLSKNLASFHAILDDALTWAPTDRTDTLAFLKDAQNLIASFYEGIFQATPHIYTSLLPLSPTSSKVVAQYKKHASALVKVTRLGHERPLSLLKTIVGHKNGVIAVAFSSDGTRLASGSLDSTVRVWDANSGEVVAGPFEGHADGVYAVAFSPDGTRLASGSGDSTVRIWDANGGRVIAGPFKGHADGVYAVAFSPDGTLLASGSLDYTVRVWNAISGETVSGPFEGHTNYVTSVVFSPDGSRLASGSWDRTIRVWDAISGEVVAGPFKGHTQQVTSVAFSPDGTRLASGSYDHTVRVWNAISGEIVAGPFKGHTNQVNTVTFSPDGTRIASGSLTIRVWDAISGEVVAGPFKSHANYVMSVAFSPDGARLASGSLDRTVRVWDISSEVAGGLFKGHREGVLSVTFSTDGIHLASGSWDSTVRIWDTVSGDVVAGPFEGHTGGVSAVAFSPDGTRLASGSYDCTVRVWDSISGEIVAGPFEDHSHQVMSIAYSPDGTRLASGSLDSTIRVRDTVSDEVVAVLFEGHAHRVKAIAFSPDGARLASGSIDSTIRVWDANNGEVVAGPFVGHTGGVNDVAFSPDGTRLASGSFDCTVRVWNAVNGEIVTGPLKGHTDYVTSVVFSPDGSRLASGSWDRTIRVWDAISGEVIADPLKGHSIGAVSVAYSPDGTRLASASHDNTIRLWDVGSTWDVKPTTTGCMDLLSHSSRQECLAFSNWSLNESGWLTCNDDLLLYIPPHLRGILWGPRNVAILSCPFHVRLDFSGSALGNDWQKCFNPE